MVTDRNRRSDPPISLIARRIACENTKWNVFLDEIEGESGTVVRDYLVVEPKIRNEEGIAGVAVLPVCGNQILLLHTFRHPMRQSFWEAARGFVDPQEDPETAALRELEEETGYRCELSNLISLGTMVQEPSTLTARVALFAATNCRWVQPRLDDEPGLGLAHDFSLEEALQMANASQIEDASTVVALYRLNAIAKSHGILSAEG